MYEHKAPRAWHGFRIHRVMKRIILLSSLFVLVLSFSACSKKSSGNDIGYVPPPTNNPNPTYPTYPTYPSNPCGGCTLPVVPTPCYYNCPVPEPIVVPYPDYDPPTPSCTYDSNHDSGWKQVWGTMKKDKVKSDGDQFARGYATIKTPKCSGDFYILFKGDYTGCDQIWEKLKIYIEGGKNSYYIKDLNDSHKGSGEVTENCKLPVKYTLKGNTTYKIYLEGTDSSVNNVHVKLVGENKFKNSGYQSCKK